jgi:hypothetical protein
MSDITDIRAYKRGHNGVSVYTLHYKIMVEFRTMPSIKIWDTLKREKAET